MEDRRSYRQDGSALVMDSHELDHIDIRIMLALQGHGRMSNVDLSEAVGLTAPPALRRTKTLEEKGFIQGYTAKLDAKQLGFDVTAFVFVGLTSQASSELLAFEQNVQHWAAVRECYSISGGTDFLLKCVARDLDAFQTFVKFTLMTSPMVETVKTSIVFRAIKDVPGVPLSLVDAKTPPAANRKFKYPSASPRAR